MNIPLTSPLRLHKTARRAPRAYTRPHLGFTLVELMMTLGIATVLLCTAVPSLARAYESTRLTATTSLFMSSMRLARSEAIKRGHRVTLCKSADGEGCSQHGGWEQGWIVFHDPNANGVPDADESIIERIGKQAAGIALTGNMNVSKALAFTASANLRGSAGGIAPGTLTACKIGAGATEARQIVIASGGRARLQTTMLESCPAA